jgi:ribosomal protein RSM22 (predicted rRNA methylase)
MPADNGLSSALLQILSNRIGWTTLNEGDRRGFQDLSRGVADLSTLFTTNRRELDAQYLTDERLRLAYLSYFLPVNAAKIQTILDELPEHDAMIQENATLRVLDIGSGPGTGALAVLDWLQRPGSRRRAVEMTATDVAGGALDEAQRLWNAYCQMDSVPYARLDCRRVDLERNGWLKSIERAEPYHLIVVANTLNELYRTSHDPVERQVQMIQALLHRLQRNGSLIIVEPALRQTARNLHRVRDRLVARQLCTVYSPCLHECSCPALLKEEDWCHEERP